MVPFLFQHSQEDLASTSSSPLPSQTNENEEDPFSHKSPRASPFTLDAVMAARHPVRSDEFLFVLFPFPLTNCK